LAGWLTGEPKLRQAVRLCWARFKLLVGL